MNIKNGILPAFAFSIFFGLCIGVVVADKMADKKSIAYQAGYSDAERIYNEDKDMKSLSDDERTEEFRNGYYEGVKRCREGLITDKKDGL